MTQIKFGTSGWRAVIGEEFTFANVRRTVTGIARSFGVSPGFFSRILHEDRGRHELVAEARRRASGREPLGRVQAAAAERGTGRTTAAVCS